MDEVFPTADIVGAAKNLVGDRITLPLEPLPDWHTPPEDWRGKLEADAAVAKGHVDTENARLRDPRKAVEAIYSRYQALLAPYFHDPEHPDFPKDEQNLSEEDRWAVAWIRDTRIAELHQHQKVVDNDIAENGNPAVNVVPWRERLQKITQQLSWAESQARPDMHVFYEDLDPKSVEPYITGQQLPSQFALTPNEHPSRDLDEVVRTLNSIPFIHSELMKQGRDLSGPQHYPSVIVHGAPFPAERIISASDFESWAGRGSQQHSGGDFHPDGKGFKGVVDDDPHASGIQEETSRSVIAAYAQNPMTAEVKIEIFFDANGEPFGMASNSHRAAAAKYRGQGVVNATLVIPSPEDCVQLPFSILDRFAGPS